MKFSLCFSCTFLFFYLPHTECLKVVSNVSIGME
nr:MAG TPA: hypothetical protein [Caudoviricetes sp.]